MLSLYETAAEYHRITVDELRKRIVAGEPLINQYRLRNGEINF